ncbi:hypothetical protein D3C84_1031940 [compost metagenome]
MKTAHAQPVGQRRAHQHAHQHRHVAQHRAAVAVDQQDAQQHHGGDCQVRRCAEVAGMATTADPLIGDGKQLQADHGDDAASNHRRKKPA